MSDRPTPDERLARGALLGFAASVTGAVWFAIAYGLDAGNTWLGAGMTIALGGIGYGLVAWAHAAMPRGPAVEERHALSDPSAEAATAADIEVLTRGIGRRRLLGGAFATALTATGLATIVPLRSLGPRPGDALDTTPWGAVPRPRLVDAHGEPIRADALPVGALVTVFPEGHAGAADAQTVLIRLAEGTDLRPPTRLEWVAAGHIAYSKICTHAGCPVGLYEVERNLLFCPCHQSSFDVVAGAEPGLGPADRALPQLPLGVDDDGYLVATGDFPDAVGPGWWTRP